VQGFSLQHPTHGATVFVYHHDQVQQWRVNEGRGACGKLSMSWHSLIPTIFHADTLRSSAQNPPHVIMATARRSGLTVSCRAGLARMLLQEQEVLVRARDTGARSVGTACADHMPGR
jgi:hypothetical protein